jgi:hypothetical protein
MKRKRKDQVSKLEATRKTELKKNNSDILISIAKKPDRLLCVNEIRG